MIFCDVISARRWRHRNKSSGGIQDLGLNFDMQNKFFNFDHPDSLESVWKEAYFSIFKVEKIVEKMPKSNIWNSFYTNSNMLNPMSTSVFLDREVRKIPNSNFAGYQWRFLGIVSHVTIPLTNRPRSWRLSTVTVLVAGSRTDRRIKNKPKELILISPYSDPFQYRIINNRCFQTDDLLRRGFKVTLTWY